MRSRPGPQNELGPQQKQGSGMQSVSQQLQQVYEMQHGSNQSGPKNGNSANPMQKWPMQLGAGGLLKIIVVCWGIPGSTIVG